MPINLLLALLLFFAVSLAAETGSTQLVPPISSNTVAAAQCGPAKTHLSPDLLAGPGAADRGAQCREQVRSGPGRARALAGWRIRGPRG